MQADICDDGNAFGCYILGVSYYNGKGVKQSYFKANKLYKKACELGEESGCKNYAKLNIKGYL